MLAPESDVRLHDSQDSPKNDKTAGVNVGSKVEGFMWMVWSIPKNTLTMIGQCAYESAILRYISAAIPRSNQCCTECDDHLLNLGSPILH